MPRIAVLHNPDLTIQAAMEAFQRHFVGRYDVYRPDVPGKLGRHFVIKKSGWTGAGVTLEQTGTSTSFDFSAQMPSKLLATFFWPEAYPFYIRSWRALENEVGSFIENEPTFH